MSRTNSKGFAFRLDEHSGVPVYRQLIDQVQAGVATGVLRVGDQLPTVRGVAVDLWLRSRLANPAVRSNGS